MKFDKGIQVFELKLLLLFWISIRVFLTFLEINCLTFNKVVIVFGKYVNISDFYKIKIYLYRLSK